MPSLAIPTYDWQSLNPKKCYERLPIISGHADMQYKVTSCSHLDVVEDYKGRSGVRSGHLHELLTVQIAAFLATFLPLWESREVLVRILVQALTCNRASPEAMAKFGSFMGKPGVPRVRVSPSAR